MPAHNISSSAASTVSYTPNENWREVPRNVAEVRIVPQRAPRANTSAPRSGNKRDSRPRLLESSAASAVSFIPSENWREIPRNIDEVRIVPERLGHRGNRASIMVVKASERQNHSNPLPTPKPKPKKEKKESKPKRESTVEDTCPICHALLSPHSDKREAHIRYCISEKEKRIEDKSSCPVCLDPLSRKSEKREAHIQQCIALNTKRSSRREATSRQITHIHDITSNSNNHYVVAEAQKSKSATWFTILCAFLVFVLLCSIFGGQGGC